MRATHVLVLFAAVITGACGSSSHPSSSPTTLAVTTATSAPPTSLRPATGNALASYLAAHPDAVVHTELPYRGSTIAIVGSQRGSGDQKAITILSLENGTARPIATLALPYPYYDLARDLPIQSADVTGDGVPDALVRVVAGDNEPGVVVSADGGTWRLVPISPTPTDVYIGRNPTITAARLTSEHNDCTPDCARGHTTTVVWHYDRQHQYLTSGSG